MRDNTRKRRSVSKKYSLSWLSNVNDSTVAYWNGYLYGSLGIWSGGQRKFININCDDVDYIHVSRVLQLSNVNAKYIRNSSTDGKGYYRFLSVNCIDDLSRLGYSPFIKDRSLLPVDDSNVNALREWLIKRFIEFMRGYLESRGGYSSTVDNFSITIPGPANVLVPLVEQGLKKYHATRNIEYTLHAKPRENMILEFSGVHAYSLLINLGYGEDDPDFPIAPSATILNSFALQYTSSKQVK